MSDVMKFLDYDGLSTFKSQMDILLADKQDVGDCVLKTGDTMSGALTIGSRAAGTTVGASSLAVGGGNEASNKNTLAQGYYCIASGDNSGAFGRYAKATGAGAHTLGEITGANSEILASGHGALATGSVNTDSSNTEAYIKSTSVGSVAMGGTWNNCKLSATEKGAFATGFCKTNAEILASGEGSFARGLCEKGKIEAAGGGSIAMGITNGRSASNLIRTGNLGAVAIGCVAPTVDDVYGEIKTTAQGAYAFGKVEGGNGGTIEGAAGGALAGGLVNGGTLKASGVASIAWGLATRANQQAMAAFGKYNKEGASGDIFVIGKGTGDATASRANAFRVTNGGVVYSTGAYNTSGADYAEITEWVDGNPRAEDRAGMFVCMVGNKMRFATSQDVRSRIGVVSANPAINGDAFSEEWQGKYKTDVFGRVESRIIHHPDELDSEGNTVPGYDEVVYTISENYDPTQEYVPREKRKEYDNFGMLGKLIVIDDGTCQVDGYCYPNDNAIATSEQDANKGFYVMERLDATHIKILLK